MNVRGIRRFFLTAKQRIAVAVLLLMAALGIFGSAEQPHLHMENAPATATTYVSIMASGGAGDGTAKPRGLRLYAQHHDPVAFAS